MTSVGKNELLVWVIVPTLWLINVCLGFQPVDNYLIDCGSSTNTTVGDRVFMADRFDSNILSTPHNTFVNVSSESIPSVYGLDLYRTARIFNGSSSYSFSIKKNGWHWIRLYFFPFVSGNYTLNSAKFSVSAQRFHLLVDFQPEAVPVVKEYSLNIESKQLILTLTPFSNSFAFLNAIEVISLPNYLIPDGGVKAIDSSENDQNLRSKSMETVLRVNMGNQTVSPENDTLWRLWVADGKYLSHNNLVRIVSNISRVNYSGGWPTQDVAPPLVYGTATNLQSEQDPSLKANMTWLFDFDPGFEYLVRLHLCDLVSSVPKQMFFNVYINSWFAARDLDLSNRTSNILGAPYYFDVVTRLSNSSKLIVTIGPSDVNNAYPNGILNGLEFMKLSNTGSGFDAMDSGRSSKKKVWVITASAVGPFLAVVILAVGVFMTYRRRRFAPVHSSQYENNSQAAANETSIISRSKIGYLFPFAVVQEATDNFSESLVIGVGGFGKVYKGVLRDNTKVAVKRGVPQSKQGLAEFRTEIEMLSQFRHRHLVSLIGYCDEQSEMIIIYEYMENGTLKNHLYGSGHPKLNWRQRLDICIGSARGLHYLHTGSWKAIIHRDVKSANILLDDSLMAKVADFGISKAGPDMDQTHVSTAVKGSFGYLDPEYLTRQQLTEKSDVYSFGVVMLEILCGRPVIDPSLPREMINLVEWALKWQQKGELEGIIDPHLLGSIEREALRKFIETAEKCLAERGADRPAMGDVLWNLECALEIQGSSERLSLNNEVPNNNSETIISTTHYSVGSMGDLAGVSMSRVFSQMVKAEMR